MFLLLNKMLTTEKFYRLATRREFLELIGGGIVGVWAGAVFIRKFSQIPIMSGEEAKPKEQLPPPVTPTVATPTIAPTVLDQPKPPVPEKKITQAQQWLEKARQSEADPRAIKAVEFALAQLGDQYLLGWEGPDKWDCARLVYFAYKSAGITFKGSIAGGKVVADQWRETQGRILGKDEGKLPGDLIVFIKPNGLFEHVGIMIDSDHFIEASGREGVVRITSINPLDPLYRKRIFDGTDCVLKGYKRIIEQKRK